MRTRCVRCSGVWNDSKIMRKTKRLSTDRLFSTWFGRVCVCRHTYMTRVCTRMHVCVCRRVPAPRLGKHAEVRAAEATASPSTRRRRRSGVRRRGLRLQTVQGGGGGAVLGRGGAGVFYTRPPHEEGREEVDAAFAAFEWQHDRQPEEYRRHERPARCAGGARGEGPQPSAVRRPTPATGHALGGRVPAGGGCVAWRGGRVVWRRTRSCS